MQQVELCLRGPPAFIALCRGQRSHILDCQSDLCDVVLDEQLRPCVGPVEESRSCDIAQIPDQTRPQQTHKPEDILIFSCLNDSLQSFVDETKVVVFACGVLTPEI